MVRYDKSTAEASRKYVRDRRRSTAGGGGRRTPGRGGVIAGGGIGAVIIALLVALLGGGGGDGSSFGLDATDTTLPSDVVTGGEAAVADPDGDTVLYLQALMFDIQDTWEIYFDEAGLSYEPTFLNVFEGSVQTGCGNATSAVGPFYCPAPNDMEVYIDLGFFDQLSSQFGRLVTSPRPMLSPTRSAIISNRSSASAMRSAARKPRILATRTRIRFARNCRPIVSPVSGPTPQTIG